MKRAEQLIKNTAIITIGRISTQLITFFLLPVYTALLTPDEFGVVDLLNTLVSLLIPIITFQIEQALFRFLIDAREDEKSKEKIISTTIFVLIIQTIIYIMIFLLISRWIHNEYKMFLATNLIATVFANIMLQISRGLGDNKNYAIGSFITALSTVLLNILFVVVVKLGAYGMLMSSLIANILCFIYIFIINKIYKYIKIKQFKKIVLINLWKYSIPLIPNAVSWWIFNAADRVIVTYYLGLAVNGILSAAHKFSSVYITIYNIFNIVWTEFAAMHMKDNDRDEIFSKILNSIIKFFSCMSIGIIAVIPLVFNIMINAQYEDAYNQIPILMMASLCNVGVSAISVIYIAQKNTKKVARTSFVVAVINIIVHLSLIKFIGLYAASISTFISYFVMMIYRYIDIKRTIDIKIEKGLIVKTLIIAIIVIISYYLRNIYISLIVVLFVAIYTIILNRDSIKLIFDFGLKKVRGSTYNEKR